MELIIKLRVFGKFSEKGAGTDTAQKIKFSIKDFSSKCDQISKKQPCFGN